MINEIAEKIAMLRKQKGYTLKEMSEACGLSISFLSQIENGASSLAITSLKKIADALEVPITYFFDSHENHTYHVTKEDQTQWKLEGSPYEFVRLSGSFPERTLDPMIVIVPPKSTIGQKYSHLGEEFVYVMEGVLEVQMEPTNYLVQAGESIHYPSTQPHSWYNPGEVTTRLLSVVTPKVF